MSKGTKTKPSFDFMFKVIIVGNSSVGKTNILLRFTEGHYNSSHMSTIGVDFKIKTVEVQNAKIRLQLWDTAGQCRFKNIVKTYFQGASGILFVYSVTDRQSFQCIEQWIKQADSTEQNKKQSRLLIANKIDVPESQKKVKEDEGEELARKHGMKFIAVSAKDNHNIKQSFEFLAKEMKNKCSNLSKQQRQKHSSILLEEETSNNKNLQKKKCCN